MQGSWAWAGRGQPAVTYRCLLKGTRTPPYILGSSLRTRCMMSHMAFTHYTASHDHGVKLPHFGSVSQVNTDVCRSTIRLLYSVLLPLKHPSPPCPPTFPLSSTTACPTSSRSVSYMLGAISPLVPKPPPRPVPPVSQRPLPRSIHLPHPATSSSPPSPFIPPYP